MQNGQRQYLCPWCGKLATAFMGHTGYEPPAYCEHCREPFRLESHSCNGYCTMCACHDTPLVFVVWWSKRQHQYVKSACPKCFATQAGAVQQRLFNAYSWMKQRFTAGLVEQAQGQPVQPMQ